MDSEKCIDIIKKVIKEVDTASKEILMEVLDDLRTPVVITHAVVHQDGGILQRLYTPPNVTIKKLTCIDEDDRWDENRHEKYEQVMQDIEDKGFNIFTETFDKN